MQYVDFFVNKMYIFYVQDHQLNMRSEDGDISDAG